MQLEFKATKIWLANDSVDFRKSINGLSEIVVAQMEMDLTHALYVFYNRAKDKLKLLVWHGNGFVMIYKRIERGRFKIPSKLEAPYEMNEVHLNWLLSGLDWLTMSQFNETNYREFF